MGVLAHISPTYVYIHSADYGVPYLGRLQKGCPPLDGSIDLFFCVHTTSPGAENQLDLESECESGPS